MTLLSVVQMNSQNEIEDNFRTIESLIQQSKTNGAELIVFPENFVCFAAGKQRETAAQFEDIQQRLEKLAHQYQIWIIAGTLPCPYRPDGSVIEDGRVRTVSLFFQQLHNWYVADKCHESVHNDHQSIPLQRPVFQNECR
jgi:deaminated glutathione amidase